MESIFESIKIRKVVFVYLLAAIGVIIVSELPAVKKISILDMNFWMLATNIVILIWILATVFIKKVDINNLIVDFKAVVNWKEIFKLVFMNIIFSLGFVCLILFFAYKINPRLFQEILNDSSTNSNGTVSSTIFYCIGATFVAPLIEEFIFRGVLLSRLNIRFGINAAIIVSSILFGLIHLEVAIVAAIVFGIIMSLMMIKTKNILIPISAHFINNLIVSLGLMLLTFTSNSSSSTEFSSNEILVFGIVGMIMVSITGFFTIKYMIKNWPKKLES